jgi:hypothetical protein
MSQGPPFTSGHGTIIVRTMAEQVRVGRAQCDLIAGKRFTESPRATVHGLHSNSKIYPS